MNHKCLKDQFIGCNKKDDGCHDDQIMEKYKINYTSGLGSGNFILDGRKYLFHWDSYMYEYRIKSESKEEYTIYGIEPWWIETEIFFVEFQKLVAVNDNP